MSTIQKITIFINIWMCVARIIEDMLVILHLVTLHGQHTAVRAPSQESLFTVQVWCQFASPNGRMGNCRAITSHPSVRNVSSFSPILIWLVYPRDYGTQGKD